MCGYSLMIAEKPSVAYEVSRIMSARRMTPDKTGPTPVYMFAAGLESLRGIEVHFTAVTGHLFEFVLPPEFDNWKLDPRVLFTCPLNSNALNPELNKHLAKQALGADNVVLWMDNDREGEAICFEAMRIIEEAYKEAGKIIPSDFFRRAIISAITEEDVVHAMQNLRNPNTAINDASLARQEVDLRVGFAFTRLLTRSLKYVSTDLFGKVVSFGPCQTPALALCVDCEGDLCNLNVQGPNGEKISFIAKPINDAAKAKAKEDQRLSEGASAIPKTMKILSKSKELAYVDPPPALNTVSFIKYASMKCGIAPAETMEVAEKLYLKGLMSYPRTETSTYPANVNYKGILDNLKEVFELDERMEGMLANLEEGIASANTRDGAEDAGDHTPILPVTNRPNFIELVKSLEGQEKNLFFLVVSNFLASISPHAVVENEQYVIDCDGQTYEVKNCKIKHHGFTRFLDTIERTKTPLSMLNGSTIQSISKRGIKESSLIDLMALKGIGTDATIATHLNTLNARGLCKTNTEREMLPSKKGKCIIQALEKSVPRLVDTDLRRTMEEQFVSIEKGLPKANVLKKCLDDYLEAFNVLDENMELTKKFVKEFISIYGTE